MMKRFLLAALAALISTGVAAQQIDSGTLMGNSRATAGPPRQETVTALLDRALAAVNGTILCRTGGTWNDCTTPVLGIPGTSTGTIGFAGITSGTATISAQATAGTPTLLLPNTSGTFAVNATSPLVLSTTTGGLTCPTCVTSSGGGAITGTAPISVSGAGVVSITSPLPLTNGGTNASLTASNGGIIWSNATQFQVLAGTATAAQHLQSGSNAAPSWTTSTYPSTSVAGSMLASLTANAITATRTPVLGLNGTATGSLGFAGSSSGTMTLQPGAAAGTGTLTIPNTAGTLASNVSAPLALGAATGTLSITGVANQVLAGSTPAFTATPTLGTNGGTGGQITFNGSTSGSSVVRVAAAAGTSTFQLPVGNGSSGQALTTDGSGNTSWTAVGGTGTVTSVATTYPISGGTITTTGTLTHVGPTQSGRLVFTSSTQLTFQTYKGDTIKIAGVVYQIPSGGVTTGCTNSGLTAATLYYVYILNNAGTLNCEISTTARATDTTAGNVGTEIKSGDNSRSLVGMIYTAAGTPGTFADADATRYVASWFNQRPRTTKSTRSGSTTSATLVAITTTGADAAFVGWNGDAVHGFFSGFSQNNVVLAVQNIALGMDGSVYSATTSHQSSTASANTSSSLSEPTTLASDGRHTINLFAAAASGGGTQQIVSGAFIGALISQ